MTLRSLSIEFTIYHPFPILEISDPFIDPLSNWAQLFIISFLFLLPAQPIYRPPSLPIFTSILTRLIPLIALVFLHPLFILSRIITPMIFLVSSPMTMPVIIITVLLIIMMPPQKLFPLPPSRHPILPFRALPVGLPLLSRIIASAAVFHTLLVVVWLRIYLFLIIILRVFIF